MILPWEYKQAGFYLVKAVYDVQQVDRLREELASFEGKVNNYGVRSLMSKVPYVRDMANSPTLLGIARNILGEQVRPIRSVYFDKVPDANWNVACPYDSIA